MPKQDMSRIHPAAHLPSDLFSGNQRSFRGCLSASMVSEIARGLQKFTLYIPNHGPSVQNFDLTELWS